VYIWQGRNASSKVVKIVNSLVEDMFDVITVSSRVIVVLEGAEPPEFLEHIIDDKNGTSQNTTRNLDYDDLFTENDIQIIENVTNQRDIKIYSALMSNIDISSVTGIISSNTTTTNTNNASNKDTSQKVDELSTASSTTIELYPHEPPTPKSNTSPRTRLQVTPTLRIKKSFGKSSKSLVLDDDLKPIDFQTTNTTNDNQVSSFNPSLSNVNERDLFGRNNTETEKASQSKSHKPQLYQFQFDKNDTSQPTWLHLSMFDEDDLDSVSDAYSITLHYLYVFIVYVHY
jgi:hypothetical protein